MRYLLLSILLCLSMTFVRAQSASEDFAPKQKEIIVSPEGAPMEHFSTVDNPHITSDEIQDAGVRNAYEIATLMSTQVEYRGGNDLYIRNLPAQIYVDGVKIRGNIGLPQKAIGEVRISGSGR